MLRKWKLATTKIGTRKLSKTDPKLSDAAKHLSIPEGIKTTGWPAVRDRCKSFGIRFDRWQDGLGRLMFAKGSDGVYSSAIGGVTASIPRQVGKTFFMSAVAFALCVCELYKKDVW